MWLMALGFQVPVVVSTACCFNCCAKTALSKPGSILVNTAN